MFKHFKQLNARDAQIVDPYEQEALHTDYLTIRPAHKSEWDICTVCYFEEPGTGSIKKVNVSITHNGSVIS
jgi:hypothetical protein